MTCGSALVLNVCTFEDFCCEQGLSVIIVLELVIGHFVCCLVDRHVYIKSRKTLSKCTAMHITSMGLVLKPLLSGILSPYLANDLILL